MINGVDTLQVNGTVSFGSVFKTNSTGQVRWGSGEQGILSWDATYASITANTGIALRIGHVNGTGLNISTGNNVLIGTTTDNGTNKLQVTGSALITGALTSNGVISSTGSFTNTSYPNGLNVRSSNAITVNGTYYTRGTDISPQASIASGITNSGAFTGNYTEALRNIGITGDNGTLSYLQGNNIAYGHYNSFTATPITTDAYGIIIRPYIKTGTITNMYDLYLNSESGGGTATNRWGIYQANTAKNFLAGKLLAGGVTDNGLGQLQVTGSITSTGHGIFGYGISTGDAQVLVGSARTADGNAFIDLIGDTTYASHGCRLRRHPGANGNSGITHRGTGGFYITSEEAGYITFNTTNLERARIAPDGKVAIGTATPGAQFHVLAPNSDTLADIARFEQLNAANTDSARLVIQADAANNMVRLQSTGTSAGGFAFLSATTEQARLTTGGNLLIGTKTDDGTNKLQVNGSAYLLGNLSLSIAQFASWGGTSRYVRLGTFTSISQQSNGASNLTFGAYEKDISVFGYTTSSIIPVMYSLSSGAHKWLSAAAVGATDATCTLSELMRLTSTGNLLIGTTVDDGTNKLQVNGSAKITGDLEVTGSSNLKINQKTSIATTSGTYHEFIDIPSWAKRITVMFAGVSTTGTSVVQVQLGGASGLITTGYVSVGSHGTTNYYSSTGFVIGGMLAADVRNGALSIFQMSDTKYVASGSNASNTTSASTALSGSVTVSQTITKVRITTINGTDTFDAGLVNIMYE